MPAVKQYSRINFENVPSHNTPLNATNLNKMDKGIDKLDDLLVTVRNNIETLQSNATTDEANILALQGETREINDNLSGFKFYPIGTQIVGLIADDSAYTDANGNYVVWGTPTAEQLVEDNPNTYKAIASTEDTRGKVGADTGIPFSNTKIFDLLPETITIRGYANQTNTETLQGFGIPTMGVYKTCTFKCTAGRVGTKTAYFKKYFLNNGVIESTTIYIANGDAPTIDISDAIYIDVVADDYNTGRAYNYIFTLSK